MSDGVRSPVRFRPLHYNEATENPCAGCAAHCCRRAHLEDFLVTSFAELDYAVYLSNFDRIELTVSSEGVWSVYYRQDCRHLDTESGLCGVHSTPEQPHVCVQYNPFTCHYKPLFEGGHDEYLRIDARRMAAILTTVAVDERRERVAMPPFDLLKRAFAAMPVEEPAAVRRGDGLLVSAGGARGASGEGQSFAFSDAAVTAPCVGCGAYCCTRALVEIPQPADSWQVDRLRYLLGFPGVELVVGDGTWSIAVESTCRHLEGTRCSIYGKSERPVRCQYYDEWACTYRDAFGGTGEGSQLRLDYGDIPAVLSCFTFDHRGIVQAAPDVERLRQAVRAATSTPGS